MKKITFLILMCIASIGLFAETIDLNTWLKVGPVKAYVPMFSDVGDVDGNKFGEIDLLQNFVIDINQLKPIADEFETIGREKLLWAKFSLSSDSILLVGMEKEQILLLSSYVSVDRWVEVKFNIALNARYQFYVDGKLIKTKKQSDLNEDKISVNLEKGNHQLVLKVLSDEGDLKFYSSLSFDEKYKDCNPLASLSSDRIMNISDVLNAQSLNSAKISPSGKYLISSYSERSLESGKTKKYTVLNEIKSGKNLFVFRNPGISNINWLPKTDRISYVQNFDGNSDIYVYDVYTGVEKMIASGISDFGSLNWSPKEEFIIFSKYREADKPGDLKRIFGADDRLPYFRGRSYIYFLDVNSGHYFQLVAGNLSSNLHDIHPEGNKILFSTSRMDYLEVPFSKQNLYEMDLNTLAVDTIWKDKRFDGYAEYSPDGQKLLVQGGPLCFGALGENIDEGQISNSYDSQLYFFDLTTKQVEPITKNFDPSINGAQWKNENELYVSVTERDYRNLYQYDFKTKQFTKINIETEVLGSVSYSQYSPFAVYTGTSISTPNKLYLMDLKKKKSTELVNPAKEKFSNVKFGQHEDWNFVNKNGTTIYGRVYYPPNYDSNKTYPVIVNYYGGTSPIERSFGGRYPINIWAANGYIVYVLQPSGATGFGQKFSALHVNGWGFDAIDDIIDGTKKFLETHPTADADNVGCIGASYGGYTTMLLQTRTDIFKTAISHAGISSITSYWGEGYWGYTYSAGATAYSYPWNRKDIYVENSPIYNADKFQNSILLLHGGSDTNVPIGESKQFYVALKLLGKDVEMVIVDGEDHWILDYKKRIAWHNTIVSWFDNKLKNQPEQWQDMYPQKNL